MNKRQRALRPCRKCHAAHRNANGYCERHQDLAVSSWERNRQGRTTTERGYGWKWQKLRKQVLERDGHLCQTCIRQGRYEQATEVDHILAKSQGGSDSLANLAAICEPCHREKTLKEAKTMQITAKTM